MGTNKINKIQSVTETFNAFAASSAIAECATRYIIWEVLSRATNIAFVKYCEEYANCMFAKQEYKLSKWYNKLYYRNRYIKALRKTRKMHNIYLISKQEEKQAYLSFENAFRKYE